MHMRPFWAPNAGSRRVSSLSKWLQRSLLRKVAGVDAKDEDEFYRRLRAQSARIQRDESTAGAL
jgi:hypothetical protein